MIWTIAKKEILENLTSYRFFVLTGLLTLLVVVSIIVSYGDYHLRMENYNILRPGQNSPNVIIPPNPLSIFAKGLDANLGRMYEISGLGIEVMSNQQSVNRLFALFTVPDMLFIIKVMLALIAVLFTFDVITSEKEQGTLKLVLASGVARLSLLMGKLLGRTALVLVPFLLMFCISAAVVSLLPDLQADSYFWQRILVILVSATIYVVVFCGLGTFISSIMSRSSSAMVVSLAIWVSFVFVIPNLGTTVARSIAPVLPADRVEMQNRLAAIRFIYDKVQKEHQGGGTTADYQRMIQQIRDANSELLDVYQPKLNRLVDATKSIVRLSPTGALTFLTTDALNTGLYEELRFKNAVVQFVNRNLERINGLDRSPIDNFTYRPASLDEVFERSGLIDVFILSFFALLFVGVSMIAFSRYDPR
jgi:ABC-type transport system involved in multi-copper enzyme maturation permease subunit